jgi:electron transport complex protein RnfG
MGIIKIYPMDKDMSQHFSKTSKTVLVLVTIRVISSISISFMAKYTYPIIEEIRERALQQAILAILPNAGRYVTIDEKDKIYRGLTKDDQTAGYAFVGEGGGYQGIIKIMIGISPDWQRLKRIIILENLETPGLGAKITTDEFRSQFENLPVQRPIEYILNKKPERPNQIQAITGATISSRAVVNILNRTIDEVKLKIVQEAP